MFNIKPIALVGGTVVCAVGFLLFIPLITELIYQTESWQSYAVPILLYLNCRWIACDHQSKC